MGLLYLSQNMTKPFVKFSFTDNTAAKNPVSIAGAMVKFNMIMIGGSTLKIKDGVVVIDSATGGTCHYEWVAGDLDTPGSYHGWAVITFSDGYKQTTNLMGFDVIPAPTT
jgi:hypothetical protein